MEFLEFMKEKERLCGSFKYCEDGCPIYIGKRDTPCDAWWLEDPKQAHEIVQKWAEENPIKTRKSVFLQAFPNATVDEKGVPFACAENIFGKDVVQCLDLRISNKCAKCWNTPVEEK